MRKKLKLILVLLLIVVTMTGVNLLGQRLMPYRSNFGSTWASYLQEEENSLDVLFFGSSLVYCDVVPAVIWENTGLRSYVMAGPEQTMPITYYYIKEACRTQSPQAVVVELNGLFFGHYQNFTKVNIGYMPWTLNRLAATFRGAETDARLGLLFPIYEYHDRIYTIEPEEFQRNLHPEQDPYAGYTLLYASTPQSEVTYRGYRTDTESYLDNLSYLRKISSFCQKNGIRLVLYTAPSFARIPPDILEQLKEDLMDIPYDAFFDCNDGTWPELDKQTVWFDSLHYNIYGAVPFSRAMGLRLAQLELDVTDENTALWQQRLGTLEAALNINP